MENCCSSWPSAKASTAAASSLQRDKVNACVAHGLSVIQGDADHDLDNYPDQAFDYAILSLTIQATRQPKTVLENLLRIGRRAIVSFPNFGHWQVRTGLLFGGRMPVTDNLPDLWYLTPNAHLCTIRDFADLCERADAEVEQAVAFNAYGTRLPIKWSLSMQNLFGEKAVFLLRSSAAPGAGSASGGERQQACSRRLA